MQHISPTLSPGGVLTDSLQKVPSSGSKFYLKTQKVYNIKTWTKVILCIPAGGFTTLIYYTCVRCEVWGARCEEWGASWRTARPVFQYLWSPVHPSRSCSQVITGPTVLRLHCSAAGGGVLSHEGGWSSTCWLLYRIYGIKYRFGSELCRVEAHKGNRNGQSIDCGEAQEVTSEI